MYTLKEQLVLAFAGILGVKVSVTKSPPEALPTPQNLDYRLCRTVKYDGRVEWQIEQYICSIQSLKELFPNYPTNGMLHIGGVPSPTDWIKLPTIYGSEEEAIQDLDQNIRKTKSLETSYIYLD